jgi:hypothetical protein
MNREVKNCQNCKNDFTIEPDDFKFYEKIKVPPPTFCPWCRFIRRTLWRNERNLYRRNCDMCQKNIISTYHKNVKFPVYCSECWYGDKWDASEYGINYDFSRPFFVQFKELQEKVPRLFMWQRNCINSDYSNMVAESRNIYLSASVVGGSENVFYSKSADTCFNIVDCLNVKNSEDCYDNLSAEKNYNCQHTLLSRNCVDSYFLVDCANCSDCFMCSNQRNKQFCIRNKQYTKEEYLKIINSYNLNKRSARTIFKEEFKKLREEAIYRYANISSSPNSTGNNLSNMKNSFQCFDCYNGEDFKYCYRNFNAKDSLDCDFAQLSELMYEYTTGAINDYNVKFSYSALDQLRDVEYIDSCRNGSNLLGCNGLYNKSNAILNKIYSKEEFINLRENILKQMDEIPYIDQGGRVYKYGEFFPFDVSPYCYNETIAQDFEPLTQEEMRGKALLFKDIEEKNLNITLNVENIPDDIKAVREEIINETIGCVDSGKCKHQCFVAFRITPGELQFYKKHNIPLPDKCANCRHYERFEIIPPPKLYNRSCICKNSAHEHVDKCPNNFKTPYEDTRPEKVYCEKCYQQEIY